VCLEPECDYWIAVERERVAVFDEPAVVGREGVVDAASEELAPLGGARSSLR
jgi:hypothetical protein